MEEFVRMKLAVALQTPYHIGSGYGMGRLVDSLLKVDADGIPFVPTDTISGVLAQGLHKVLRFACFDDEWRRVCDFHRDEAAPPALPCALVGRSGESACLLCRLFGSTAQHGLLLPENLTCVTAPELVAAILERGKALPEEKRQIIQEMISNRRNMRTQTVLEDHLFVQEEGAALDFCGAFGFLDPITRNAARYLAAAVRNTRAIGRRKSRGKGSAALRAEFFCRDGTSAKDVELLKELLQEPASGDESKAAPK